MRKIVGGLLPAGILSLSFIAIAFGLIRRLPLASSSSVSRTKLSVVVGDVIPLGVLVDIVDPDLSGETCRVSEAQDIGEILRTEKKAVIFGVPGAFTPTCSAQHLPGFVSKAEILRSKGVSSIYCLSVNDRFVMRAWGEQTPGCVASGIKLIADGNGEFVQSLGLTKDATGSRMGVRSKRFAAVLEYGTVVALNIDEKGLNSTSADQILELLG